MVSSLETLTEVKVILLAKNLETRKENREAIKKAGTIPFIPRK